MYIKRAEKGSAALSGKGFGSQAGEGAARSLLCRGYVQPASDNVTLGLEI